MRQLTIRNFGPIKDLSIPLNRINVFIGPQSCGKSSISKIISFCSWLEKECITNQKLVDVDNTFISKNFFNYHRLSGYVNKNSYFKYETEAVIIEFIDGNIKISYGSKFYESKAHKTSYIPAERIIASVPGIRTFEMAHNNLRTFLFDWWKMAPNFQKSNAMVLPSVDVKYYFNSDTYQDKIIMPDGNELEMPMASSGLQSMIPLYANLKYATEWVYEHEDEVSYEKKEAEEETFYRLFFRSIKEEIPEEDLKELISKPQKTNYASLLDKSKHFGDINKLPDELKNIVTLIQNVMIKHYTNIIIEEPELNLFPKTQVEMLYDVILIFKEERDNLYITTHSPYIVYALNNCMLSYLVKEKLSEPDILEAMDIRECPINPKNVSVWQIEEGNIVGQKGINSTIQDEDGLIRENYFDDIMGDVITDFKNLMSLL